MCLSWGQAILSDSREKETERQRLYVPWTFSSCFLSVPNTLIGEVTSLPWAGIMTGMGERENVPILWAEVGTWAVEENGLSYNRFYFNPLSYHLLKSDTDHTAPDILLCNAVEFNSWSERVGKFSNLFMGCGDGCDGVFYLQRHQKYMLGSFDFSFSFLKSCQRLFTYIYQW